MAGIKTVLITGGSSGIGYAVSEYFARSGYQLIWASWSQEELNQARAQLLADFPDVQLQIKAIDLSLEKAPEELFEWTQENQWKVDVLINNAGFGTYGFLQETDMEKEVSMINLHILCTYKLTRLFLDKMLQRNEGTIINISSNSSFQPIPKLNTYASTKAFVRHFTRGLNEELKIAGSKVKALCVCPAAVSDTPFRKSGKLDKIQTYDGLVTTTVAEVAGDIWKGFQKKEPLILTGRKFRFLYLFYWLFPFGFTQMLIRREIKMISE
ncbi:MAG: SDR family NAD(P)-dependent oxidoreductase [Bacteroidota bacterium]